MLNFMQNSLGMKRRKLSVFSALIFLLGTFACSDSGQAPAVGAGDWSGFELADVTGSDLQQARKLDGQGMPDEEGYLLNGVKQGIWITYHPLRTQDRGERAIKTIENYINGRVEGISLEFDQRGQITKKAFLKDDQYHGLFVNYKFGRPQDITPYKNGKLHGKAIKYYPSGKIREEIEYQDGMQHGFYNHYNEQSELDMRYEYRNGEKVSGGMVEPDQGEQE